ncbi:MAG: aspartate/tyrosine/aromatic aminotransferase [Proteobacteria bacterium]|nr:aspartate/tyrosine/aromatic aminotransferase [Pseudomonadota bacterium]MBU1232167.1 aspartate/tyrosine/aromatic aminotransferase [Pseudomonadota bacterium]MBU1419584.1 aspartate/tyrosine/aromatic aminotransferase [Pseudomonadota bacterium]MBU1455866.1 aspartate/tyrosine/aromatic aminotransferase [Pseudomonadota bacterium]
MWKSIQPAPPDSILGLTEEFKKDKNPDKVNLGVGVYKDDAGNTPVLRCVKAAEKELVETQKSKSYLPISGDPAYAAAVQRLLFGTKSEVINSARAATVHAPGGTGALRVGADLIHKFNPEARVWVSSPTWANHNGIFGAAGFEIGSYSYYNAANKGLDFDRMFSDLEKIPAGDIVVLHTCCHNPSGVDLNPDQWQEVAALAVQKGWIPFLDFAYQGFGDGVIEDRFAVEQFAAAGIDCYVASSFSKNFGLYNERTGAMTVVTPSGEEATVAMSHLKTVIRTNYSNPPAHGGLVASIILNTPDLHAMWLEELAAMRNRIVNMRKALVDGLSQQGVEGDFSYIEKQRGMFSFSGWSEDVVKQLRVNKGIYMVGGGRINLAGLTTSNIEYVCSAVAEAMKS